MKVARHTSLTSSEERGNAMRGTYIALAKRLSRFCASVTVLAWLGSALAQAQRYTITDLGSLGGTTTIAYGENSHGDAVGFSYSTGAGCYFQAFRYTHASGMTDIGRQPSFGGCNYAVSINDAGQIAFNGDHHPGSGDYTAHLFSPSTGAVDLGTLPGDAVSYAVHLNAFGEVVGGSASSALLGDPFLYIPKKGMIDLGNLGGGRGTAEYINNLGFVVGSARVANTPVGDIWNIGHAFVYTSKTGIIDLNTLTATPGWELYDAHAINNFGLIVGYGTHTKASGSVLDAYRFNPWTREVIDLGTFPGGGISYAYDINSKAEVVGAAYLDASGAGNFRAALWLPGHAGALNLNDLVPAGTGWTLRQATAINDAGQIVGWGYVNGQTRAFRLDPVDEQ
jgi:probable HAF family extracellular repeat protein